MAVEVIEVEALDVKALDRIFFPNSRHAQQVIQVTTEDHDGKDSRRLYGTHTQWVVPADFKIRKEVEADAGSDG